MLFLEDGVGAFSLAIIPISATAEEEIMVRPLFVQTVFAMLSSAVEISSFFRLRKMTIFQYEWQIFYLSKMKCSVFSVVLCIITETYTALSNTVLSF